MRTRTSVKREAIDKAQGMADYEQDVMVVLRQDGTYFIRAARDLGSITETLDWMMRYGIEYAAVLTPTGSKEFSGMSAQEVLAAVVARMPVR